MPMLHQLHVGSLADVVIDKGVKIAHCCCHVSKRVVIIWRVIQPLSFHFAIISEALNLPSSDCSSKSQFTTGSVSPDVPKTEYPAQSDMQRA